MAAIHLVKMCTTLTVFVLSFSAGLASEIHNDQEINKQANNAITVATTDVTIRVTDESRSPVRNAAVSIVGRKFQNRGRTNTSGIVEFDSVPLDRYVIEVQHTGAGLAFTKVRQQITARNNRVEIELKQIH